MCRKNTRYARTTAAVPTIRADFSSKPSRKVEEVRVFDEVLQDVRYGARTLLKAPGFAAVAILTLALGIGANSAIFSFVDAAMLKPLPYANPERILQIWEKPPGGGNNVVSALNFLDWQSQSKSFRRH